MRSIDKAALASVLALSGALLAGCENHNGVRICSDGHGRRLPDNDCGTDTYATHGGGWIYIRSGSAPAVGGAVIEGERMPAANVTYGSAPAGGVSRGGFGGTGEGFGGGGEGGGE